MRVVPPAYRQPIRRGQRGSDVKAVKRAYRRMAIRGSQQLILDGRAGDQFVACTKVLQRAHHLPVDGVYGPATHKVVQPYFDRWGALLYRTARIRITAAYVVVSGCPVPYQLAPYLRTLLAESGARLVSAYRGTDAQALLHQLGKRSQAELYYAWTHRLGGALPANPPGYSTHELRNDGYAYGGARGSRLAWWQCGLDIDDSHVAAFEYAAARHGWRVTRTYPNQASEYHHVNFRTAPVAVRARVALRRLATKGG